MALYCMALHRRALPGTVLHRLYCVTSHCVASHCVGLCRLQVNGVAMYPKGSSFSLFWPASALKLVRTSGSLSCGPVPKGICDGFCSSTGCGWTAQHSCPWASADGTSGRASDDGSLGYKCCCEYNGKQGGCGSTSWRSCSRCAWRNFARGRPHCRPARKAPPRPV